MLHCPNLMAPDGEELLAAIFGEEDLKDEKRLHLEHCPTCQQRLKGYQQTHTLLSQFYRVLCPDGTQLTLYCKQALSPDDMYTIADHLHECHLCLEEVKAIRLEFANFTPFPDSPPFSLQQMAQNLKRITAQLIVQPAKAVRSELTPPWPRYYQANDTQLSLHLARASNNQIMLLGMFTCDDDEQVKVFVGSKVELFRLEDTSISPGTDLTDSPTEKLLMSTIVDPYGHFSLAPLHPGMYTVHIYLSDTELLIEQVKLE